jgi:hypothetical protein
VSEYIVLCHIFRNSSGRRSKNLGGRHRTGIYDAKMKVAVDVGSVSVPGVAKESAIRCGQAHFLEKFGVSGVAVELFEQWIAFDLRESGVALFIGILEPFK